MICWTVSNRQRTFLHNTSLSQTPYTQGEWVVPDP